jgi:hypothetical protein
MFGVAFWGPRFFGPRYWGGGAIPRPPVAKQIVDGWAFNLYTPLINFVAYDPSQLEMMIQFTDKTEVTYSGVPYNTALSFQYSQNPDNYYNTAIKGSFQQVLS